MKIYNYFKGMMNTRLKFRESNKWVLQKTFNSKKIITV